MNNKRKKVILISGTRKGIGRYLAEYYSKKSYIVIGCSRRPINFSFPNYGHYICDISDENQVKKMLRQIKENFGRLDILINNAGVNLTLQNTLLVSYKNALKTLEINLLGSFLLCRESSKIMLKNTFGRIINFSSMAVKHEVSGESIYTASKAAIVSFSRVLSKEIYSLGITVNVVAPSAIETELTNNIDKKALKDVLHRNAIHQMGKVEDIVNVTDWLIRTESQAITGQVIYLGGV